MRFTKSIVIAAVASCWPQPATASVTEFNNNRNAWLAAAGPYSRIDFTGFAPNTIITNQYLSQGVAFTDGTDRIYFNQNFVNDGVGLNGALNEITLAFTQPMNVIAVDHPGSVQFKLYSQGQLIYISSAFVHGGTGFFAGLISTQSFDAALIYDPTGAVFIDDLYFGAPVPAPGVLAVLIVGCCMRSRRKRSDLD